MKRLALLLTLAAAACSSGSGNQKAKLLEPDIDIRQLVGPADLQYPTGRVDIQFELRIANPSAEPITLQRVEASSVNGGAYVVRRESYFFNQTIAAGQFATVQFWAHAIAYPGRARQDEPVTFRGIAFFSSPAGAMQKVFFKNLSQFPGANE